MSLLLQALQKAAKNRDETTATNAVRDEGNDDLTLEPLAEPQFREETAAKDNTEPNTSRSPEDAAGVMRANELPGYSIIDWARDHYMLTFVAGAALFAILYGLYVYMQISSPGMFRPTTPPPANAPIQSAAAPASNPAPAIEATPLATAAADNGQPHISGLPEATPEAKPKSKQPAVEQQANTATTTASESALIERSRNMPAVAVATKQPARATPAPQVRPLSSHGASARMDKDGVEVVEIPLGPSVTPIAEKAGTPAPARKEMAVRAEDPAYSQIDPVLMLAYEALQSGDYEKATVLYGEVLSRTPDSIDAMLGLAAIAWKQGRPTVASQYYGRVLEIEPRNTHAQAGLIAILGNVDPIAGEARLQQLIDRDPSGFLYFTLGNLYAQQNLWSQAQQAYFQALQFQPNNADYAYNLAVGLEHLGKTKPALDYYRKALDLSFKSGRANFDQKLAIERVGQLSARVD